jgi:glutamate carboxypeptidase
VAGSARIASDAGASRQLTRMAGRGAPLEKIAAAIGAHAARELDALVAVSSPSGDAGGAEAAAAVVSALLPDAVEIERLECSSPAHAPDLLARLRGGGQGRLLLLGHLDTVVAHDHHRPLRRRGERLVGSGTIDMKGGVVLATGVLRALSAHLDAFAEVVLLCVMDEEWRSAPFAHVERFGGFDACLCFEAGQRTPAGEEAVVVRRKAAATLLVEAHGRAAHSGAAPDRGRNALLALGRVAAAVAERHSPAGPERLTAVPTILRSGDAFNVVPAAGELYCDLRADREQAFDEVLAAVETELAGVKLKARLIRVWPGMDARSATAELLAAAATRLGGPIAAAERGGASDASHMATAIPVTIDGLGPRGGGAHAPGEYVLAESLAPRAAIALAVAGELLGVEWRV